MELTEKTLSSTTLYEGRVVTLKKDEIELPNGEKSFREAIHNSGGACVLAVCDGYVYFVKQFRYPYKKVLTEIPAGKINDGESPMACALRELEEETGLIADRLELMHRIYPTPAYTDEVIYIYLAKGVKKGTMKLDNDEFLNVEKIPVKKIPELLSRGGINDAKTLIALYTALYNGELK